MNNENIFQALGIFLDAMRPFLVSVLQNHFPGEPWEGVFFQSLGNLDASLDSHNAFVVWIIAVQR